MGHWTRNKTYIFNFFSYAYSIEFRKRQWKYSGVFWLRKFEIYPSIKCSKLRGVKCWCVYTFFMTTLKHFLHFIGEKYFEWTTKKKKGKAIFSYFRPCCALKEPPVRHLSDSTWIMNLVNTWFWTGILWYSMLMSAWYWSNSTYDISIGYH